MDPHWRELPELGTALWYRLCLPSAALSSHLSLQHTCPPNSCCMSLPPVLKLVPRETQAAEGPFGTSACLLAFQAACGVAGYRTTGGERHWLLPTAWLTPQAVAGAEGAPSWPWDTALPTPARAAGGSTHKCRAGELLARPPSKHSNQGVGVRGSILLPHPNPEADFLASWWFLWPL